MHASVSGVCRLRKRRDSFISRISVIKVTCTNVIVPRHDIVLCQVVKMLKSYVQRLAKGFRACLDDIIVSEIVVLQKCSFTSQRDLKPQFREREVISGV